MTERSTVRHITGQIERADAPSTSFEIWDCYPDAVLRGYENGRLVSEISAIDGRMTVIDHALEYARVDDHGDPDKLYEQALHTFVVPRAERSRLVSLGTSRDPIGEAYHLDHATTGITIVLDPETGFVSALASDNGHGLRIRYTQCEPATFPPPITIPAAFRQERYDLDPSVAAQAMELATLPVPSAFVLEYAMTHTASGGVLEVALGYHDTSGRKYRVRYQAGRVPSLRSRALDPGWRRVDRSVWSGDFTFEGPSDEAPDGVGLETLSAAFPSLA